MDSLADLVENQHTWNDLTKYTALSKLRLLERYDFDPEKTYAALSAQGYSAYTLQQYFIIGSIANPAYSVFLKTHRQKFKGCYQTKTERMPDDFFRLLKRDARQQGLFNLVYLMGECGLRLSEALNAQWSDFFNEYVLSVVGKGNKQRQVACPKQLLDQNGARRIVGDIVPPARLRWLRNRLHPYTPHSLRAYFITRSLEKGYHVHDVKDTVGHVSLNTTSRYIRTDMMRFAKARFQELTREDQSNENQTGVYRLNE